VISKFFFIDFLDESGLFIGEKPVYTKKKFPSLCRRLPPSAAVCRRLPPSAAISWLC
jgi:hypothetical protein